MPQYRIGLSLRRSSCGLMAESPDICVGNHHDLSCRAALGRKFAILYFSPENRLQQLRDMPRLDSNLTPVGVLEFGGTPGLPHASPCTESALSRARPKMKTRTRSSE